eukprot:5934616-Prymnesium_polylepis.1
MSTRAASSSRSTIVGRPEGVGRLQLVERCGERLVSQRWHARARSARAAFGRRELRTQKGGGVRAASGRRKRGVSAAQARCQGGVSALSGRRKRVVRAA